MDDVKVHYNSAKPAQLNAHAYAQGTDIHIASGQEKHLPHEAWHVVQQKQGRVRPTTMMKAKVPVNDDQGLEKEADVMGARALQMKPFSLSDYKMENSVHKEGLVQRKPYYKDENNLLQAKLVKVDVGSAPIQMKLMTEDEFIKASGSMFSGTRDRVLEVDAALKKCISASSKSVGFTELIGACDKYLNIPEKKDKTRIAGVTKLKKNAVEELAAWRLRDRMPLPASVFRMDERGPGDIAKLGFQPWNGKGNISIVEHVKQVLKTKQETAPTGESGEIGMGAKKHSQFVSTAGDMNFAKDPTLLAGLLAKKFYKIDTTVDPLTFTDVNKHFDELGEPNPYEPQFEFIKSGGIPGNQVTHYVEGKALIEFVIAQTDASTWDIKWLPMPQSNA